LLLHDDGSLSCFYLDSETGEIIEVFSDDMGDTWSEVGSIGNDPGVIDGFSPFLAIPDGFVWTANITEEDDEKENYDLFARIFEPGSKVVSLGDIKLVGTSTIASNITNIGDTYIYELDWEITVVGDSPLGQFLGGSPLLMNLFRGRIFSGGYASDTISLSSMESEDIASNPVSGLGHVMVTITISHDDEVLAEDSEDGFLLGSRLFLFHGVV